MPPARSGASETPGQVCTAADGAGVRVGAPVLRSRRTNAAANSRFCCPCSIPAVLCSNNWQSADVGQQPSGHRAADQPSRLSPVSAVHVHPLPEFDQDSWTLNAPPETDKTRENPQPLDLPNNNNNNNNSNKTLTHGQRSAAGQASEADSTSPPREAGSTHGHAGTPAATASNEAAATWTTGGVEPPASHGEDVQESSSSSGDVLP